MTRQELIAQRTAEAIAKETEEAKRYKYPTPRKAEWAIEAEVDCELEGHPHFADGRCVRCRAYQPAQHRTNNAVTELEQTAPVSHCPHYTTDQGCPLHGETCR